jgi:hypothetical protein
MVVQYIFGAAFTFLTSPPKLMLYCSTLDVQKKHIVLQIPVVDSLVAAFSIASPTACTMSYVAGGRQESVSPLICYK